MEKKGIKFEFKSSIETNESQISINSQNMQDQFIMFSLNKQYPEFLS